MSVVDASNQRSALMQHEPVPSQELLVESAETLRNGIRNLALSAGTLHSVIVSTLRHVPTSAIPTMAVTIAGDGFPMLMYNPEFTVKLGADGCAFVLAHEASHLLFCHLYVDPELSRNELWTLASEATINHWVMDVLNSAQMPLIPDEKGAMEETGVNPRKLWQKYRDDLKKQDPPKEHVTFEDFVRTDLGSFAELQRMAKPPKMKSFVCTHGDPNAGQNMPGGGQNGRVPLDQEEVDRIMTQVLETAMHEAKVNDNGRVRDQLLKLAERTQGSAKAEKVWGDLGLGALRGEPVETRKTNYWKQWLTGVMAEKLEDGLRLRYNRKMVFVDEELGRDASLAFRGQEPYKSGIVVTDTSGSMHNNVLDFVRRQCGQEDGLHVDYWNFDTCMYPVEVGKPFAGGGGTNFQCISDHVDHMDDKPDFVLVITDGYAPHITPKDPDLWIWLIVPNGDSWPDTHQPRMDCRELPADEID